MPAIQKLVSVPANATVENALSGSAFEFLRRNAVVSAGVTATVTGVFVTVQSGGDIILEESDSYIAAGFPRVPDEMVYNDVGVQGDRLVIRLRNSTGAPILTRVLVQLTFI